MVSGFFTSPCDHWRIFSGDASEMRIALNESGSLGFSKKLKMSFTVSPENRLQASGFRPQEKQTYAAAGFFVGTTSAAQAAGEFSIISPSITSICSSLCKTL